jgi:ubiquinone/menaquinone biosynthesis C-methylase UbiE
MKIYERYVLPKLIHLAMQNKTAMAERAKLVPLASGTVLEVGAGSGLNIPFYGPKVGELFALDPSLALWKMARSRVKNAPFPVRFLDSSAERIPLGDMTVDTVVTTWTLCTIQNPAQALTEMRRVLKPEGQLIFVEHGRSQDRGVFAWQDRLNPMWKRVAGGCNLNRRIDDLILDAGFCVTQIERAYSRGPRPFTYLYKGLAQPLDRVDTTNDGLCDVELPGAPRLAVAGGRGVGNPVGREAHPCRS